MRGTWLGVDIYEDRLMSDGEGSFIQIRGCFPYDLAVPLKDFKQGSNKVGIIIERIK